MDLLPVGTVLIKAWPQEGFPHRLWSLLGPVSLPIPSPALGALCPCSFNLHKSPEGEAGRVPSYPGRGSALTDYIHRLFSHQVFTPTLHKLTVHTPTPHTPTPHPPTPHSPAQKPRLLTHQLHTHPLHTTNSTITNSPPNIPLSPCPPMPNSSRPRILNGSAGGSRPMLTALNSQKLCHSPYKTSDLAGYIKQRNIKVIFIHPISL